MTPTIEELHYAATPLGELILRRRVVKHVHDEPIYEVRLGGAFLMSSLNRQAEEALATLTLATHKAPATVLVGGLGLGHTAHTALMDERVHSLTVVEYLEDVLDWFRSGLVPLATLTNDDRCVLEQGDFFARMRAEPTRRYDAILVDIDHSPSDLLTNANATFYQREGLARLREHLAPGGVFGLWSSEMPDPAFLADLDAAVGPAWAEVSHFYNPLLDQDDRNTIYGATRRDDA